MTFKEFNQIDYLLTHEMIEGSLVDNWNTRKLSCRCFDSMLQSFSRRGDLLTAMIFISIIFIRVKKKINSGPCQRVAELHATGRNSIKLMY